MPPTTLLKEDTLDYRRVREPSGWNNLLRGKYSTHWRRIQCRYKQDQSTTRTSQLQLETSPQSTKLTPNSPLKRKTDVFQRVFDLTTTIVHEMWLERNKDRHEPMQGQQRIAKLTEATQTVEELYSLRTLIMKQHESVYYALPLAERLEMSVTYMLSWVNCWKIGIYQSMRRANLISLRLTRPIWKMWEPN